MNPIPRSRVLVIGCGALAQELVRIRAARGWSQVDIRCLPPELHNRPERIPGAVARAIDAAGSHAQIIVAYGDCGTGGRLDALLGRYGVERLPGVHCYELLAGPERFREIGDEETGSFYLTDFLVRHFRRLVIGGLGLDRHPELRGQYFGNYRRVVHLAQRNDTGLRTLACQHASCLGLPCAYRHCGNAPLAQALGRLVGTTARPAARCGT